MQNCSIKFTFAFEIYKLLLNMATIRGSFANELFEMQVGEVKKFPISNLCRVRSGAAAYGAQWERKYSTHICREEHCVEVTREA